MTVFALIAIFFIDNVIESITSERMKAVTLRISGETEMLSQQIQKKTKLKQSDVLRLAIERGLPVVEQALAQIMEPQKKAA